MSKIAALRKIVEEGTFPNKFLEFGGANLIITKNPNRNFHEGDTIIYSEHSAALSWLVIELKTIYKDDLNHKTKYNFYPYIGDLIKESLKNQGLLFDSMLYVIDQIESDWGTK